MTRRTALFWNVERLFAPKPTPLRHEVDLAGADLWSLEAYRSKIRNLAAVLRDITDGTPPILVGLTEVEDHEVVGDLVEAAGWADALVEAVDPDEHLDGLDTTLLYNQEVFETIEPPRSHNIHLRHATRDIFEVSLRTTSGQDVYVLVNHWPSRRISGAGSLRIGLGDYAARLVERQLKFSMHDLLDSQGRPRLGARAELETRWNRPIIVMGDFNDSPFDVSVAEVLAGRRDAAAVTSPPRFPDDQGRDGISAYLRLPTRLYNPSWQLLARGDQGQGTYNWNGEWYVLDQMLFSRGAVVDSPVRYVPGSLRVHAAPTVTDGDTSVEVLTAAGNPISFNPKTHRGVSDHLPVVCEIDIEL